MTSDLSDPKFHDEDAARAHLEALRWPNGPYCPHCGNAEPTTIRRLEGKSHRPGLYQCNECREHFTVTVGTVMERSHIPLAKWVLGFHLMNASKKGMSAHQLHRMLGITYKSAWFMAHRIREAMRPDSKRSKPEPMGGKGRAVQVDETYYGNTSKRAKHYRKGHSQKSGVVCLVDPEAGQARAFKVESATVSTVREIVVTNVSRESTLVTDESRLYYFTGREFEGHEKVHHTGGEYVNKAGFTINNVENFFGIFKKGMAGTYHFCGEQHLQRYLWEFSFRYSHRSGLGFDDTKRAELAMKRAAGKRLTYRGPCSSENTQRAS
jgi:transposase-like protein